MEPRPATRRGPKPKPDTRDNLLQAGLQMIHAEGYSASGIQGIVDRADVPKGSFYTYFASKEAFGAEVIDLYSERGQIKLRDFLCDRAIAPLARLEAYFDDRIAAFRSSNYVRGCLLGNFSADAADHSTMIRDSLAGHFKAWSRIIENCLLEARDQGAIGREISATSLADFILNSWEGALLRMRAEKSDAPLITFKTMIFGKMLR
ncbi:MAG TPA: TetR family transcriptional regulator C-terminal domain-containing protein [Acidocella sp.]|jgi:TetR/AcrR family transcriptional repressor of nem operon|uniref:TetR/AcrR family transcriptional regulator n=1 Tax=Acidocella sp. TaxID=50710 RepID=UPI002CB3CFF0|nr:TetR family transcriptional regulator C-terminal domain-containing protein [Acidocella sp.]HVE22207.1 TetR family transcriptional regulator C-terminal domain-containing protein [Acidocella sp.]